MKFDAFYSDPHFGHAKIINYSQRPFENVDQMNDQLIENYNSVVSEGDTVLWLGDCFFLNKEKSKEILNKLNGKKWLLVGNHDKKLKQMEELGFDYALYGLTLKIAGQLVYFEHYPKIIKDTLTAHGHTHDKRKVKIHTVENCIQFHLGVDAWNYFPVTLVEFQNLITETIRI